MRLFLDPSLTVGEVIQFCSVIPPYQQANPHARVVLEGLFTTHDSSAAALGFTNVEYRQAARPSPGAYKIVEYLLAPRRMWWGLWGLDWFSKRLYCPLFQEEITRALDAWGKRRPRVLIQARGGRPGKAWPHVAKLAVLLQRFDCNVVLEDCHSCYPTAEVPRAGVMTVRECLALAATADLFVGYDSGPLYAALGNLVRAIAFFPGAHPAEEIYPLTQPKWLALFCPQGAILRVPLSDVFGHAIEYLGFGTRAEWGDIDDLGGAFYFRRPSVFQDDLPAQKHEKWLEPYLDCAGKPVLEVGAHIGTHSVHLAAQGVVTHLVEPNPLSVVALERNLRANGLFDRCVIHRWAAGQSAGRARLRNAGGGSHVAAEGDFEVEVRPLDSLLELGVPFGLVKMDVEAQEDAVLLGAERLLRATWPRLLIDSHENIYAGVDHRKTVKILREIGYNRIRNIHPSRGYFFLEATRS